MCSLSHLIRTRFWVFTLTTTHEHHCFTTDLSSLIYSPKAGQSTHQSLSYLLSISFYLAFFHICQLIHHPPFLLSSFHPSHQHQVFLSQAIAYSYVTENSLLAIPEWHVHHLEQEWFSSLDVVATDVQYNPLPLKIMHDIYPSSQGHLPRFSFDHSPPPSWQCHFQAHQTCSELQLHFSNKRRNDTSQ